jgi:hypothetical protein
MGGLARWCIHHKILVLLSWVTMLVALGGVVGLAGSAFSDSTSLPASDSATAYNLLARAGSDAAKVTTGTIVWFRALPGGELENRADARQRGAGQGCEGRDQPVYRYRRETGQC